VLAAVGRQRLQELILVLAGRVQALAEAAERFPESAEECLAGLHQSRGSAASLGFVALAEGFARAEALGRQAADERAGWEAVRQAGRELPVLWNEVEEKKKELLF